jgi:translation initiation factor 2B subunit (eIF-2B alpha/beta/delta family)
MVSKQSQFNQISKNIKSIKIQGARNIAIAGFQAYKLSPTNSSKQKLLKLRATEPMLENILKIADELTEKQLINKLKQNQEIINKQTIKLIKQNSVVFTHCHSSTVIQALINAKKKKKEI